MKILLFFCGIFISFSQEFNDMVFAINESEPIILKLENYKLNRDIAQFVLTGDLAFFKSRNNEYQIGYFKGNATFALKPPGQIEQEQLQRYYQVTEIQTTFSEMFFITLDNTFNEMSTQSKSSISAADMKSEVSTIYSEFKQSTHHSLFLKDFLENNKNGSFASLFSTTRFDELYFDIFMSEDEEIRLSKIKKAGTLLGKDYVWPEIMTQFNKKSDFDSYLDPNSELTEKTLVIDGHQIDAKIADNYEFSAKTVSHFTPQKPQKWIPLSLYYDIEIDSVIDNKQRALNIYRNEDFYGFWIELKEEINEPFDLTFYYHCEALRRYGNYIYLWDATGWYPTFSSREYSTFDIHYQFPNEHFFASVGDLISFKKMDNYTEAHYKTQGKIRNASFNIGVFYVHKIEDTRIPKIVLSARTSESNMKNNVAPDIANSFNFFQMVYGKLPEYQSFNATEIPLSHGEAFPGLIHLSYQTFETNLEDGSHEIFRAHEVAHQWWGIGVDFKTYHDQWISEGFSSFSGLWYMQLIMKDNDKFINALKRYKRQIQEEKLDLKSGSKLPPISLGHRASTSETGNDYSSITYRKGAFVLHMLRMMMIDYKTFNEDRFTNMMKEFFNTYKGKRASTADFKQIVSKHAGEDMSWFFNQWVDGSEIPNYTWAYKSQSTPDGYDVQIKVKQDDVPDNFKMIIPIQVNFGQDRFYRTKILVDKKINEIALPYLPLEPESIEFNIYEAVLCEHDEDDWDDF